jgi:ParB family transcriptional regulator, chromosome partitioning protein
MQGKKKALGRGLSAILESPETDITSRDISGEYVAGAIAHVKLDQIDPNPFQPRVSFDEDGLAELVISIQSQGLIQPITIRKMGYDRYQIISGERRFRACRIAGMTEIPAYIRIANDEQMLEMALVENIQRTDLNPLEIAISYQRLVDECNLKQEEISKKVGKDRTTVSNYIRLLSLPTEIQLSIRDNRISMGHARAVITIEDVQTQLQILRRILEKKLSVRQVEDIVRNLSAGKKSSEKKPGSEVPGQFEKGRDILAERLGIRVEIRINNKGKGFIRIPVESEDEFNRIVAKFDLG